MGNGLGIVAAKEADFMIHSLLKFELFGQELYLTTTHVSILLICLGLIILALIARVKLQDTDGKPGRFQNAVEYVVEMLDGMVKSGMGKKGIPYRNYIGTLFLFILFSNLSGLLGLRPPTADYGVTFPLGVITFFLIQFNNIRYNKVGAFTNLFKPLPFLFPINLIGEIAVRFRCHFVSSETSCQERLSWPCCMVCFRRLQSYGQVFCMPTLTSFQGQFRHTYFVC